MLFDIFFAIFILVSSLLCLFEFIVFNEEILLTFCFLSFIFFCYNALSDTVTDSFNSRSLKFETDLLLSYNLLKTDFVDKFNYYSQFESISSKLKLLLVPITIFLTSLKYIIHHNLTKNFNNIGITKLADIFLNKQALYINLQKSIVYTILYPFVFKTSAKSSLFFTNKLSKICTSSLIKQFNF
jgi:hypothetical protein